MYAIIDNIKSSFSTKNLKEIVESIIVSETGESALVVEYNDAGLTISQNSLHRDSYGKNKNKVLSCGNRELKYSKLFTPFDINVITGVHHDKGIFIAKGPNIKSDFDLDSTNKELTIQDVVPNLLYLNNLPVAKDMQGKIVEEIFPTFEYLTCFGCSFICICPHHYSC